MTLEEKLTRRDFLKAGITLTGGLVAATLFGSEEAYADTRCPRGDSIDRSSLKEYQIVKETGMHPILGVMVGHGGVYYVLTSNVYKDGVKVFAHVIPESPLDVNLIYDNDDSVRLEIEHEKPFGYGNPYGSRFQWEVMYGSDNQRLTNASDFFQAGDIAYREKCWNRAKTLLTQGLVIYPKQSYYWQKLIVSYMVTGESKNALRTEKVAIKFNPDSASEPGMLSIDSINKEFRHQKKNK